MQFVDADSHIEDGVEVFSYLDSSFEHRRPFVVDIGQQIAHRPERNQVWLIDGEMRPKLQGRGPSCFGTPPTTDFAKRKPVSPEIQALADVDGYVEKMRTVPLDRAVNFSTLFLHPVTEDPFFEAALMSSWNSYMYEQCQTSAGAVQYGALIPMTDAQLAVKEVHRAAEMGAAGVMVLPVAGERMLHDRYFDDVYEAIEHTGLPLCVHVGYAHNGIQRSTDSLAASLVLNFEMSMVIGMFSFFAGGILDRFTNLRVAFLEAGTLWLPALLDRIDKWRATPTAEVWPAAASPADYIASGRVFFTVEGDEDGLRQFVDLVGVDQILASADFPHVHYAGGKLGEGFTLLRDHADFTEAEKTSILGANAERFYRFS